MVTEDMLWYFAVQVDHSPPVCGKV